MLASESAPPLHGASPPEAALPEWPPTASVRGPATDPLAEPVHRPQSQLYHTPSDALFEPSLSLPVLAMAAPDAFAEPFAEPKVRTPAEIADGTAGVALPAGAGPVAGQALAAAAGGQAFAAPVAGPVVAEHVVAEQVVAGQVFAAPIGTPAWPSPQPPSMPSPQHQSPSSQQPSPQQPSQHQSPSSQSPSTPGKPASWPSSGRPSGPPSGPASGALSGPPPKPPSSPPPAASPRSRKRRDPLWARLFLFFGALLMLGGGGLTVAVRMASAKIDEVVTTAPMIDDKSEAFAGRSIDGAINLLLVGLDVEQRATRDGAVLSDTIIVAHIPATHDRAYLLSIPRDTRVQVPASAALGTRGYTGKINSAFGTAYRAVEGTEIDKRAAGMTLLSETVYATTGIKFTGAMLIDFDGFRSVIQELGGVEMCVDHEATSIHLARDAQGNIVDVWYDEEAGQVRGIPKGGSRLVHEVGCREFTPQLALDYSRIRKSLPNGDFDRQKNQQKLIKAIIKKATGLGMITDFGKLNRVISAGGKAMILDTGGSSVTDFVFTLQEITADDLVTVRTNPGTFDTQMINGISYVNLSDESRELFRSVSEERVGDFLLSHPHFLAAE